MMAMQAFSLDINADGIACLTFDLPGEKINKLSVNVMRELDEHLNVLAASESIRVLIFRSGKEGMFIAGADIDEIAKISDRQDGQAKAEMGQAIFNRIYALPFPTVAAIQGVCLGGGLELALACSFRVVSDGPRVRLGMPEVNLGIIPGFGGTQRLPRLLGLSRALPIILSGKPIDAKKALRIGLVDAIVSDTFFHDKVVAFSSGIVNTDTAQRIQSKRRRFRGLTWLLERTPIGRMMIYRQAKQSVLSTTKGHYPAPLLALESVKYGYRHSLVRGLAREAEIFSKLVITPISANLIRLFYAQEAMKKDKGVTTDRLPTPLNRFGVLGAGLMGGGISWLLSYRKGSVRMKDVSLQALGTGLASAKCLFSQLRQRKKMTHYDESMLMHRLSPTLDYSGFDRVDMVIEAIVERMDVKKAVFQELESIVSDSAIIASNTSGLSITEMATVLKRPERFVGFHFFSPVNRMPLVEVIRGEKTSDETVAAVVALAKELKKTPVVVKNCPGFLVNRILIPYVNEAVRLVENGVSIERVDRIASSFGMPLGPLALADEVGLDVGYKVAKQLEAGYGGRMTVTAGFDRIRDVETLLGKKSGYGFYRYDQGRKSVNQDLMNILEVSPISLSDDTVRDRLILVMVNEASRCLSESIVSDPMVVDMAMILGTGFPPFRGGLCRYADSLGVTKVYDTLMALSERFGDRFYPSDFILDLSTSGRTFYKGE